jgi:hypothetical protein
MLKSDKAHCFKVFVDFSNALQMPILKLPEQQIKSNNAWRNNNLQDPLSHTEDLINEFGPFLKLDDKRNVLLVTKKDDVYVPYLTRKSTSLTSVNRLTNLGSDDLHLLDSSPLAIDSRNKEIYDLILCRHALEHSRDPLLLLNYLAGSLSEKGVIMLEVPSCELDEGQSFLEMFWEEHLSYFSLPSISSLAQKANLEIIAAKIFKTENEPIISVIAQKTRAPSLRYQFNTNSPTSIANAILIEWGKARNFFSSYEHNKKLIFLGANHKTVNLIDLFSNGENVILLDGDKQKVGKFVSKFNLEVLPIYELKNVGGWPTFTTISQKKIQGILAHHSISSETIGSPINIYSFLRDSP